MSVFWPCVCECESGTFDSHHRQRCTSICTLIWPESLRNLSRKSGDTSARASLGTCSKLSLRVKQLRAWQRAVWLITHHASVQDYC